MAQLQALCASLCYSARRSNVLDSSVGLSDSLLLDEDSNHSHDKLEYALPSPLSAITKAAVCIHDPYQTWQLVEGTLQQQLIEFKYKWKDNILENLQLDFVSGADERNEFSQSDFLHGYKSPHVFIYVVNCDDLDSYKSNVKLRLQAWVEKLTSSAKKGRADFEWFILYVPKKESLKTSGLLKKSNSRLVYDRLKSDFNGKRARCCKVSLFEAGDSQLPQGISSLTRGAARAAKMSDLLDMLCSSLACAFESKCDLLETEISANEAKKDTKGWNFYTYFILKESLAFLWIQLGQFKQALSIYDSLAEMFVNLSQSKTLVVPPFNETQSFQECILDLYKAEIAYRAPSLQRRPDTPINEQAALFGLDTPDRRKSLSRNNTEEVEEVRPKPLSPLQASSASSKKTVSKAVSYGQNVSDFTSPRRSIENQSEATSPAVEEKTVIPAYLLDVERKAFRDQIFTASLSTVEVEMYIFARQALLLFAMKRPHLALRRGAHVISLLSHDIASLSVVARDGLEEVAITQDEATVIANSWALCASLELVCAGNVCVNSPFNNSSLDIKAKMYLYADLLLCNSQRRLHLLAKTLHPEETQVSPKHLSQRCLDNNKWLQSIPSFLWNKQKAPVMKSSVLSGWLPLGLLNCLKRRSHFVRLYDELLRCRAEHCVAAGRPRTSVTFHMQRATLLVGFGNFRQAASAITQLLVASPTPLLETWPALACEAYLLKLRCDLKLSSITRQVASCLEALHPCFPLQARAEAFQEFAMLRSKASDGCIPLRLPLQQYPVMTITALSDRAQVYIGQYAYIQVQVVCLLPSSICLSAIKAFLQTTDAGVAPSPIATNRDKDESAEDEFQSVFEDPDTENERSFLLSQSDSEYTKSPASNKSHRNRAATSDGRIDISFQSGSSISWSEDSPLPAEPAMLNLQKQGSWTSINHDDTWYTLEAVCESVQLSPGVNNVTLKSTSPCSHLGEYSLSRFTFDMDALQLESRCEELVTPVQVTEAVQFLDFELKGALLMNSVSSAQEICISIQCKKDALVGGTAHFDFAALKPYFKPTGCRVRKLDSGEMTQVSLDAAELIGLDTGECVEIFIEMEDIGVLNEETRDEEMIIDFFMEFLPVKFSLQCRYDNQLQDVTTMIVQEELPVQCYLHPLTCTYSIHFIGSEQFFQLKVKNCLPYDIDMIDISLSNDQVVQLVGDEPSSVLREETMGLLYKLCDVVEAGSFVLEVLFNYKPKWTENCFSGRDKAFTVVERIPLLAERTNMIDVGLVLPEEFRVGKSTVVKYNIETTEERTRFSVDRAERETDTPGETALNYEVKDMNGDWLVLGKCKAVVEEGASSVAVRIMPLIPGWLLIPSLSFANHTVQCEELSVFVHPEYTY